MIVMDASAAMAIAGKTEKGKALASLMLDGEQIIAPDFYHCEVGNAVWKSRMFGGFSDEEATAVLQSAIGLVDEFLPMGDLLAETYGEAARAKHSIYDMLYLVLARRTGATLFTLDKKLADICREAKVSCIEEVAI